MLKQLSGWKMVILKQNQDNPRREGRCVTAGGWDGKDTKAMAGKQNDPNTKERLESAETNTPACRADPRKTRPSARPAGCLDSKNWKTRKEKERKEERQELPPWAKQRRKRISLEERNCLHWVSFCYTSAADRKYFIFSGKELQAPTALSPPTPGSLWTGEMNSSFRQTSQKTSHL